MDEKSDSAREQGGSHRETASVPRRINVAVTPDMMNAIDLVIDSEMVTLTEAVRRLIGYGNFVYRSKIDGAEILVRYPDGTERQVVFV